MKYSFSSIVSFSDIWEPLPSFVFFFVFCFCFVFVCFVLFCFVFQESSLSCYLANYVLPNSLNMSDIYLFYLFIYLLIYLYFLFYFIYLFFFFFFFFWLRKLKLCWLLAYLYTTEQSSLGHFQENDTQWKCDFRDVFCAFSLAAIWFVHILSFNCFLHTCVSCMGDGSQVINFLQSRLKILFHFQISFRYRSKHSHRKDTSLNL